MMQPLISPLLLTIIEQLAAVNIKLVVTQKRVKNINFRLKPNLLMVSVPLTMNETHIAHAIAQRVGWAIANHAQVVAQYEHQAIELSKSSRQTDANAVVLWGELQTYPLTHDKNAQLYRQQLAQVTPDLLKKWQPIVGAHAHEVRFKKMHTRWGSCNTRARRIWLSTYLPAHPIECTEYVIVHELCHLHHANHSRAFWQTVATAMPDYRKWHDRLAGKSNKLD